jgi:hypothetical protein
VEITNENSFFMWGGEQKLRGLPPFYAKILRDKYNGWLRERYGGTTGLRMAWGEEAEPLGETFLPNGDFQKRTDPKALPDGWSLEQHGIAKAEIETGELSGVFGLRVRIRAIDDVDWHLQLAHKELTIRKGQYYTLSFRARAESARSLNCGVRMAHDPWQGLGLGRRVDLAPEWKSFRMGFIASASDDQGRVLFSFGDSAVALCLAEVELRPGGQIVLDEGEGLEKQTIELFGRSETRQRAADRLRFLFDDMRRLIKSDLGYKGLVTGTIAFVPLGLYAQSDMDYIDAHAYWNHPRFPGRPWDPTNWIVEQESMTACPGEATFVNLALKRIAGKPFTVSEYNHPAPNDFQAECVPMIASFAALHDWDGVWIYSYKHGAKGWDADSVQSFFDIHANPAKLGFMRAGAALFRDGGVSPFKEYRIFDLLSGDGGRETIGGVVELAMGLRETSLWSRMAAKGIERDWIHHGALFGRFREGPTPRLHEGGSEPRLVWESSQPGHRDSGGGKAVRGWYIVQGDGGWAFCGFAGGFAERTGGALIVRSPEFAVVTVTPLDGAPLSNSQRVLVTACGRCENTDMKFSDDRRTVGRNWGHGPVRVETVDGYLYLPNGAWTCRSLGLDGAAGEDTPLQATEKEQRLQMSPRHMVMWYLLSRQE